jgi:hypothetical protein
MTCMPKVCGYPKCRACGTPYVLRRVFIVLPKPGAEWLWQRDCKHKKAKPVAVDSGAAHRREAQWKRRAKALVSAARDAQVELTAKTIRYAALVSVMTAEEEAAFTARIRAAHAARRSRLLAEPARAERQAGPPKENP